MIIKIDITEAYASEPFEDAVRVLLSELLAPTGATLVISRGALCATAQLWGDHTLENPEYNSGHAVVFQ